jgi:Ser/Thr protein kinase RdoA (MazF antagonist)
MRPYSGRKAMHPRNGDGSAGPKGRAGVALGRWHGAFRGAASAVLRPHTIEREPEALRRQAGRADPALPKAALERGAELPAVVHRDLYEDQVLIGERVGLIDLDDVAVSPPELDVETPVRA